MAKLTGAFGHDWERVGHTYWNCKNCHSLLDEREMPDPPPPEPDTPIAGEGGIDPAGRFCYEIVRQQKKDAFDKKVVHDIMES